MLKWTSRPTKENPRPSSRRFRYPARQGVLEIAFGHFPGVTEKFEVAGILGDLRGHL
jgi:hypothetical protein